MFVIPRYDWPVDRRPTQARYTSPCYVSGGVEVSMELEATLPAPKNRTVAVTLVDMSALRTLLARVFGVHEDNLLSEGFSFVHKELLELKECPVVELPVEPFALSLLDSNMLQILKYKDGMVSMHNLFCDAVVNVGHKPFLPPADALELSFGGTSAFGLQPPAEIGVLCPGVLDLFGIEENVIRTDGEVDDATVDSENWAVDGLWCFLLDSDMDEEPAVSVREGAATDLPVKVLLVVFRHHERSLNSTTDCGDAGIFSVEVDAYHSFVVPDGTVEPELRELFEFDSTKGLARNISGRGREACRQAELLPDLIVGGIVDLSLSTSVVLVAPFCTVAGGDVELLDGSDDGIPVTVADREFELECPSHDSISGPWIKASLGSAGKVLPKFLSSVNSVGPLEVI